MRSRFKPTSEQHHTVQAELAHLLQSEAAAEILRPVLPPDFKPTPVRTMLLYAQDNRGMGHITRTLTIARHILAAYPDFVAYITTRSKVAHAVTLPERCDYLKLPSRQTPKTIQRTAEDDEASKRHFRELRGQLLRDAALGLAPNLVVVDHEPLGSSGEFREGLYALKQQCPASKFVFGLRDIMDDADRIRAQWQELGVYDALENLYDCIAVYGVRNLYDVADAYAIPLSVQSKLHYCGYIVRDLPISGTKLLRQHYGLPENGPLVVGSVGSGYDGYPVLEATVKALEQVQTNFPDLLAIIVTGPLMPPEQQARLQARATDTCRVLTQADNFQLMAAADAIVSMGGYNSVCEALAVARPLVIVPRATHKVEQQIRAEALAAHGLARWIHPKELNGQSLADALKWALRCDRQSYARAIRDIIPSFDGAARLTEYLSQWLGTSRVPSSQIQGFNLKTEMESGKLEIEH